MQALERRYGFENYWEFEAFDAALTQQLAAGQLVAIKPLQATSLTYQPDAWYQRSGTTEVWALSTPDNAWRGYFLPPAEALTYQQKLRGRDQRGKIGCLVLALTIAFIVIWQTIRLFLDGLPTVSP